MNNLLVSIVVPVYNVEGYIGQCIESLIKQTYLNLEIILVDDGSTDASGFICDRYAKQDRRIKVIHKSNGGLSSARKAGISKISGDYVTIVDGDDWIDLNTIEMCINKVIDNPNLECILFSYVKEYPNKSIQVHIMDNSFLFNQEDVKNKIYKRLFGLDRNELEHPERMHNIESCCMKLYKASLAKNGRFFDTSVVGSSEDALFNMYALYDLKCAYYLDEHFYHYRKNPKSLTNVYRPFLIKQWGNLFDIMFSIIKEKELGDSYVNALNNRIALSIYGIGINELSNTDSSSLGHIKIIKKYLNNPQYRIAIRKLDMSKMPLQWKGFMLFSKWRLSFFVYLLLVIINQLKKRI